MVRPFFSRLGGKSHLIDSIVPKFPLHKVYVEPFIGAGAIFLSKPLAEVNVINDIDKNIHDLWSDLRVIDNIDFEFMGNGALFDEYLARTDITDPYERFKRNMFLNKCSFCSNMVRKAYKDNGNWRAVKLKYLKKHFQEYKTLLNNTIVKNDDYKDVIKEYDSPDTLFYLDPPYSKNEKYWSYGNDVKANDLYNVLKSIQGRFVMSYDDTPQNRSLFENDFYIKSVETIYQVKSKGNKKVNEILISNFDLS